jgi:hypothetical protein
MFVPKGQNRIGTLYVGTFKHKRRLFAKQDKQNLVIETFYVKIQENTKFENKHNCKKKKK